jgi:hypothetical protein
MATVTKDFRIKSGLVVEGTNGTINGSDIITEDAITGGTQTNITVTYNPSTKVVDFVAENGVADSTTSDLAEGTNLYFTDERAQDAVGNSVGTGISYNDTTGAISVDRTATDPWYDAAGSAATVQTNLETHSNKTDAHGVIGDIVGTTDTQTLTNKTMGDDLLMNGFQISGLGTPDQADHAATKAYVDGIAEGLHIHASVVAATTANITISNDLGVGDVIDGVTLAATNRVLVKNQTTAAHNGIYVVQETGSAIRATDFDAPAEVDGGDFVFVTGGNTQADTGWVQTSEGVVTIGLDPIYFTQFSGAGTYLAGNGLTIDGNTFEIDETITATRTFASGEAATAEANAIAYADGLDTDDIAEGSTNQYYTTSRAKTDAAALLTGATLTNITITGDGSGLTITAENGVADSDTDDLDEGTTNLYFTDARAVSALQAVVPDFTEIEVNNIARQVAATVSAPTAGSPVTAYAFAKASYRSAKFLVKVAYSSHTEVSEVLLTLDTSDNIAITEYAVVGTNGSSSAISADIDGTNVRLRVTPVNASSTVKVYGTLIS